ncbi:DUF6392 family protein [Pseudomonas indica]|uniref:DUF6392 family protein n=1 Tax=Pseudomonas indica TaxID=137658 RepID=UPI0023F84A67|nr:DUF6392 family protein [Pseudomonas indica]MBU3055799.1 pyocin immunity protein [Pseudomonas indica]
MNAAMINRWIGSLGRTYDELVSEGAIPNQLPKPMFDSDDNEDLIQNPIAGVKLWFSAKTTCLKKVMVTLVQTVGQPVYTGELPPPFTSSMNQKYIHGTLGMPVISKTPAKFPGGLGVQGGSDTYLLNFDTPADINVTLGYLENLVVNNISFSLASPSMAGGNEGKNKSRH